jgi:heat shock protein HtpX
MKNIYEQVSENQFKSLVVVSFFFAFITAALYLIGVGLDLDQSFIYMAFGFSALTSVGSYYFSDKIVLGLSGARPADHKTDKVFFQVTENLVTVAGIPMPKLYVIEDQGMNAFATGRNPQNAAVCATRGLLNNLNRTQLEGVVAHELAHVRNYDTLLMTVVAIMVGSLSIIADWVLRASMFGGRRRRDDENSAGGIMAILGMVALIISPIVAELIKLAISRRREFYADAVSAKLTRYPEGLIQALEIISKDPRVDTAQSATAHLFIANPLGNVGQKMSGLFATHPPVSERIKALKGEL